MTQRRLAATPATRDDGELGRLRLAKPAQRALQGAGHDTLACLAAASDDELLALHGMGRNALRRIPEHTPDSTSKSG